MTKIPYNPIKIIFIHRKNPRIPSTNTSATSAPSPPGCRHRNRKTSPKKHIEALDRKIERLQEKVIKKHKEYSVLAEELSTLLDERHPERKIERVKQVLYDAYVESERSLDEIIDLIRNADEWI